VETIQQLLQNAIIESHVINRTLWLPTKNFSVIQSYLLWQTLTFYKSILIIQYFGKITQQH